MSQQFAPHSVKGYNLLIHSDMLHFRHVVYLGVLFPDLMPGKGVLLLNKTLQFSFLSTNSIPHSLVIEYNHLE